MRHLAIHLCCLAVLAGALRPAGAATWYVDNAATGGNQGSSWANAWQSFADIRWGSGGVTAGDTLLISGGATSKTYTEQLSPDSSGSAGAPITIRPGDVPAHSGEVIITATNRFGGIYLKGTTHVQINGEIDDACHIIVRNCAGGGISLAGATHGIFIDYLEVDGNGDLRGEHGISINVTAFELPIVEIAHCRIHDNFQDQINANKPLGPAPGFGYIRVYDCDIYNLADDGFQTGVSGVDFFNNRMHGRRTGGGTGHVDGLQFMGDSYRIYNNTIYNLDQTGLVANAFIFIDFFNLPEVGARAVSDVLVFNNLLYEEEGNDGSYLRGIALKVEDDSATSLSNILFANNTVVGMPAWALNLAFAGLPSSALDTIVIENNVFYNCAQTPGSRSALLLGLATDVFTTGSHGDDVDLIIDYNAVSAGPLGRTAVTMKEESSTYADWLPSSGCQDNGVTAEPSFDARFRPLDGASPLVDAGVSLGHVFAQDLDGTPRPQQAAWDLGAFEYQAPQGLAWSAVPGATWYRLWVARNGQGFYDRWQNTTNATWTPSWDWPSGKYSWWVQPWGANIGLGSWSAETSFSVAPSTLSWASVTGATWHQVWMERNGSPYHDQWLNQTHATWQPGWDLDPGEYEWWVRGWGPGIGYSDWSGPWTLTVNGRPWEWDAATGATSYQIWINANGVAYHSAWLNQTGTTFSTTWHLPAANYEWWVRPWGESIGFGSWNSMDPFSLTGIPFRWAATTGATWYQLWIGQNDDAYYTTWLNQTGATWSASWNWEDGTYSWWIRPWSPGSGLGDWSDEMTFQTP